MGCTSAGPTTMGCTSTPRGFGVYVAEAYTGMCVGWADGDGFSVPGAGGAGMYVGTVGQDGVRVHQAGSPSWVQWGAPKNGFEVAGAEGYGLYVGRADLAGVYVNSAGTNGVDIYHANVIGLDVYSAGFHGVYVHSAGFDGEGGRAGDGGSTCIRWCPSATVPSDAHNGFEVAAVRQRLECRPGRPGWSLRQLGAYRGFAVGSAGTTDFM